MSRVHKRFVRFAMSTGLIGVAVLPGTCAMQLRDAAITGLAGFITDAVGVLLNSLIPITT